jgi:hypothetical protein
MTVELLYFAGCPHYKEFAPHLEALLAAQGMPGVVTSVEIRDSEHAQQSRFLGSPTVRVDGRDVEPSANARTDFGMQCRLYPVVGGLQGAPPDDLIIGALVKPRRDIG